MLGAGTPALSVVALDPCESLVCPIYKDRVTDLIASTCVCTTTFNSVFTLPARILNIKGDAMGIAPAMVSGAVWIGLGMLLFSLMGKGK